MYVVVVATLYVRIAVHYRTRYILLLILPFCFVYLFTTHIFICLVHLFICCVLPCYPITFLFICIVYVFIYGVTVFCTFYFAYGMYLCMPFCVVVICRRRHFTHFCCACRIVPCARMCAYVVRGSVRIRVRACGVAWHFVPLRCTRAHNARAHTTPHL